LKEIYSDIIKEFEKDCKVQGLTKESIRGYISNVRTFSNFLQERGVRLEDISKDDLIDFITYLREERHAKATTLEQYFSGINSLYDFLLFKEKISRNFIPVLRKRYLKRIKKMEANGARRKAIPQKEMALFLNSILNPRDKAIATLFVKTGIRRGELISIDIEDIDWGEHSITLKEKRKRSNTLVFFDSECAKILKQWIQLRDEHFILNESNALFIGQGGGRLKRQGVYRAVTDWARRHRIHNEKSEDISEHFSPHNLRHCFTTYLLENGMKREYVQELRGDARKDAVDIYNHIPKENLREAYLAAMPQFGL